MFLFGGLTEPLPPLRHVGYLSSLPTIAVQLSLKSEDYGKHLLGVQDLLQKHTLAEADITTQRERAKVLATQVVRFVSEGHPDRAKIEQKGVELEAACQRLTQLSAARLGRLQESLKVQEFYLTVEEEEAWVREKEPLAYSTDFGRDQNSVAQLQQKHQMLEGAVTGMLHLQLWEWDVCCKECTSVCGAWEWDVCYKECTRVCRAWEWDVCYKESTPVCRAWEWDVC